MQHLDEGTIHAWLDGALPAEQAADVERHARTCAECAALVADARGVIAGAARIVSALDEVPGGVIPARSAQSSSRSAWRTLRLTPFRAALAASLMVAVASLLVVRNAPKSNAPVASPAVAMPTTAAAASAPPAESNDKAAKETNLAAPARPRLDAVASAVRKTPATVLAPASAPPAAALERVKTLAEVRNAPAELKDEKSKAVVDTTRSIAAEPKARVAELTSAVAKSTSAPTSGAAAPAAPPAANAMRAAAPAPVPAADAMREAARREVVAGQPALFVAVSADNRLIEAPGCFQLRDSVTRLPQIPERFSLEFVDESGGRQNIVRAVNKAGRRDSIIPGITWELAPGSMRLVFLSNDLPMPVMAFRSQPMAQSARDARRAAPDSVAQNAALPRISKVDCR